MYKTKRRYQGEPVRTDPTTDPKENETAIHFTVGDRNAWISSYEASVVAGLLAHPDFKVEQLVLMRLERADSVVGVVGKIPVAALRIGPSRETSVHDQIVSAILKGRRPSGPEMPARKMLARNDRPAGKPRKTVPKVTVKGKPIQRVKRAKQALPKKRVPVQQLPLALSSKGNANNSRRHNQRAPQAKRAMKTATVTRKALTHKRSPIKTRAQTQMKPRQVRRPTKARAPSRGRTALRHRR
jgi:hypothetical protein